MYFSTDVPVPPSTTSDRLDRRFDLDLEQLPLILAGPLLRRTECDAVTVWLALKQSRLVTLKIHATKWGEGSRLDRLLLQGERLTVCLGQHLHVVAVTARPIGNGSLRPGEIYAYDLGFGDEEIDLRSALNAQNKEITVSYFPHYLPTFCLPPEDLNCLRIVHGSCRKPHGGGLDALPLLDRAIERFCDRPNSRPHQLFLTGDQIYGDDVADPFLAIATFLGDRLLGWQENLPFQKEYKKTSEFKPGKRSEVAEEEGGFTAMLKNQSQLAKSHLFGWGEYAVAYLLAWSPVLWPESFPSGKQIHLNNKLARQWDREVEDLGSFIGDLWQIRRILANIPTYTICDDHDISDDWYLNREWCDRVLGKPLGRRVVQNGLLAYAIFQAWGNTPEQFVLGKSGDKLLSAAKAWSAAAGKNPTAEAEIGKYLGIPPLDPQTGKPRWQRDGNVLILARDPQALAWNYTVRSSKHEAIVLDTRTWRGYPPGRERAIDPPMLMSPTAFEKQLERPLKESEPSEIEATLIVLPTNLVTLSLIDLVQRWDLTRKKVFNNDVGDSWNFNPEAFTQLLVSLWQHRDRVAILSGDIHYSCAVRLSFWSGNRSSTIVQLTSSALKNSEWSTRLIHTKFKSLFPEPSEAWMGWKNRPELMEVVVTPQGTRTFPAKLSDSSPVWRQIHSWQGYEEIAWQLAAKDRNSLPDWQYRLEWIKREPNQKIAWEQRQSRKKSNSDRRSGFWNRTFDYLTSRLWRNQWWQEGEEVVGRNNLSIVRFQWSPSDEDKAIVQESYWHPPWKPRTTVRSDYLISFRPD